jgi:hypothetical protein
MRCGRTQLRGSAALLLVFLLTSCEPQDERPGLWLSGDLGEAAVSDWSFTDEFSEIFVETRTWYGVRHSTTIWCVDLDDDLYIGSYDDDVKYWERNVARNPEARLRIEGRIHDVTVTPVSDRELSARLDERYAAKYDMAEVFGDDLPAWRYYRALPTGSDPGSDHATQ